MMEDSDSARGELNRADHLLYVTLKYTRTTDVIKNIIRKFVGSFEYAFEDILTKLKERKKIKEIPGSPIGKVDLLERNFPRNKALGDYIDFYFLLKKILKQDYIAREEFRKHVTMKMVDYDLDVPLLNEFYLKSKYFVHFTAIFIKGGETL